MPGEAKKIKMARLKPSHPEDYLVDDEKKTNPRN
jgi:hypothetical protein